MFTLSVVPLLLMTAYAFMSPGRFGGVDPIFTLDNWSRAFGSTYVSVMWNSVLIAGTTTILALIVGFPLAYVIAALPAKWRTLALLGVILPFWTNFLIRTYSWIVLLNNAGPVNSTLIDLGVISEPLGLLYTKWAVVIGLLYAYLPLMVLPVYAALSNAERELGEAAVDLGARTWRVFRDVHIPLSLPGIITGSIFVFVPSIGNFIIPDLLGGGKTILLGNLLRDQFLKARDWPLGSVLAVLMIVFLMALFAVQAGVTRRLSGKVAR